MANLARVWVDIMLDESCQLANITVAVLERADICREGVEGAGVQIEIRVGCLCRVVN